MRNVLVTAGVSVERVEIHDVIDDTFYATMFVRPPGAANAIAVDARPSDALALAMRCAAPIFVSERVLAKQAHMVEAPSPPSHPPLRLASVADLAKWRM